jgi:myo-inositol-1(or 4)-monophosphatase
VAREAGKLLMRFHAGTAKVFYKGEKDLVTEADRASEALIFRRISAKFHDDGFLAEEGTSANRDAGFLWIVDPLDGTTNFAHGFPFFAVSIGIALDGEVVAGVVFDPCRGEMFSAMRGRGSFLDGRRIRVSKARLLGRSLLGTGFPYDVGTNPGRTFPDLIKFCLYSQGVRRPGAAALDLCYIACGRLDGFWEGTLAPWDVAAGFLIIEEAGGKVTDYAGKQVDIYKAHTVATNGKIHRQMLDMIASDDRELSDSLPVKVLPRRHKGTKQ